MVEAWRADGEARDQLTVRWMIRLLVPYYRVRFWARRKLRLGIRRGDFVLDVGSGHDPHWRADVLLDYSLTDDVDRHAPLWRDKRPLVIGDIQRLPFRDKAFDFIICAHVLEHVQDPAAALEELSRVGRRGYIETPSEFGEKCGGLSNHRWFVNAEDGRLVFTRKPRPFFDDCLARHFHGMWRRRDPFYMLWSLADGEHGLVMHAWSERIEYSVRDLPPSEIQADGWDHAEPARIRSASGEKAALKRFLKRRLRDWSTLTASTAHARRRLRQSGSAARPR